MLMATPSVAPVQVVADGSELAMKALKQQAALDWLNENKGRLILWGAGIALTVAVVSVVIVTILSALFIAMSAIMPILVVLLAMGLVGRGPRRRRRYRRWMGPY